MKVGVPIKHFSPVLWSVIILVTLNLAYGQSSRNRGPNLVINLHGVRFENPIPFVVDFRFDSAASSSSDPRFQTTLSLQRPYVRDSDWQKWFKDYQRDQSEHKTIIFEFAALRNQRPTTLNESGEALPVGYKVDSSGNEILTINAVGIKFH